MSKRAAIYARVSTDDQRGNYSIPTQLAACLTYLRERNYALVGNQHVDLDSGRDSRSGDSTIPAYVDDYSSRELSRPSLNACQSYLESSGFDVLIVHALDRLARDPYIRRTIELELHRLGAEVEYVLGNYEDSAEGEVRKALDATFAMWENAKRVERVNRGKCGKARSGLFVAGRAPYGYTVDKSVPGGLAINQQAAEIVRQIFHLYVDKGASIRGITTRLNAEKVPPQLGGKRWAKSSVHKLLSNEAYVGRCYYNKFKRNEEKLVPRDHSEWIPIQVQPIIDEALFDLAQVKLSDNREIRKRTSSRFYLLTGLVFCADCGKPYVAYTQLAGKNRRINDAPAYRHRVKEQHCKNHIISARLLEPVIWERIVQVLLDPSSLRSGYEESLARQEATKSRQRTHLEILRKGLIKIEQKRKNLITAHLDPEIGLTRAEFLTQKANFDDEQNGILQEIEPIEKELQALPTLAELETLEAFSRQIASSPKNQNLAPHEKRQVLETLHVKVMIGLDDTIQLDGWFYGDGLLGTSSGFHFPLAGLRRRGANKH